MIFVLFTHLLLIFHQMVISYWMEDAKYFGRDWTQTGNWPQLQHKPIYNHVTPDDFAQVLRCGSPYLNFGASMPSSFLHSFTVTPWYLPRVL